MSGKQSKSAVNYFSQGSGFKIQPKTVLIMSLVYIGIVVLLHIYSKMSAPAVKPEGPQSAGAQNGNDNSNEKYTEQTL